MRTAYNESDRSVFNDYEESIIFDEDDPDFRPSDDFKCSCNTNGKLIYKLLSHSIIRTKLKYLSTILK